ncbi:YceI family protein [Cyclobacterium salsum]|uniref:YceI family protein n=1 Tax=Cyclobacterium salsum TaxID=2666329 RepID=UPI001391828C|nr:YceI family protein [Cyclobacterium salsum]
MKNIILTIFCLLTLVTARAQDYKTETGEVVFFSSAPVEDITAKNNAVTGLFNTETGSLAFLVPIKAFRFPKSLMQEHFNEKFMDSDTYPEATFDGKLTGYSQSETGSQDARAKGKLTIHGVTVNYDISGTLLIEGDQIKMEAVFPVKLEDHDIQIPSVLFYNIAEEVEVTANFVFEEIKK